MAEAVRSGPKKRWDVLRDFAAALAAHAGASGLQTLGLVAAAALLDGAGLLLIAPLLGAITGGAHGWTGRAAARLLAHIGIDHAEPRLWALLGLFLVLGMLRAIAGRRRDVALAALQAGFAEAERIQLIATLAAAPWPRLVRLRHSTVNSLLSIEVPRVASASNYLIQGGVQAILLAVQALVVLVLSPGLAAAGLLMLAAGTLALAAGQRRIQGLGEGFVKANQAMMASAAALLGGLKSALAQNAQHAFVAEFETTQGALVRHQLAFAERQARARMTYSIASALLAAALVAIGFSAGVPAATLLTLIVIIARMGPPAQQLYQNAQALAFALPGFEAVRRMERDLDPQRTAASACPTPPPEGPIELSNVTYLHPGGGGVRGVDLTVPPGSFLGIGGPTGAGKTTLVDLAAGLIEPQVGTIKVGGTELAGAARRGWGECVAYVAQDGFLFDDTVRRNLLWGAATTGDSAIAEALRFVDAENLVSRLEHGLETMIGERGATLSGGERQRLILARALLRRPRLLVLDEAASAMDAASEAALLERFKALAPRPAILMISHREESLRHCDCVIRIEDGAVRRAR